MAHYKEVSFHKLKKYTQFLLENKLEEITAEQLRISREMDLSLLQLFTHLSEEELLSSFRESFRQFLTQILAGEVLSVAKETMQKWKEDKLPDFSKNKREIVDILLSNTGRKQALFNFLIHFTTDPSEIISIVSEIEKLYKQIEELAFTVLIEIKQEDLRALNSKLKDYQEELQATNKELKESHEELQVSVRELHQQAEQRAAIEKALEKERNFLQAILENIGDGIVACNEDGILSFFNKATQQFHGLPEKALPAEEWAFYYNLYHPDETTLMKKEEIPLFRAYNGEVVKNVEMVIAPVHGKRRILLASGSRITSSTGKKMGAVVVMHDITEQKEAEKALHESNKELSQALEELQSAEEQLLEANSELEQRVEQRTYELSKSKEELQRMLLNTIELKKSSEQREHFLSSILDQTPVSTWISDAVGTQIRVNEACLKLFRVEDPELGLGKYNILQDDTLVDKPFFSDIKAVFSEGKIATFEAKYDISKVKHVDIPTGKEITVITTIFPIKDAQGVVTNAVIQHEDITQRKKAEKALKESEVLFRTIANASPVALWMSNEDGEVNYVNQTWIQWTGRSFEEHLGQGWSLSIIEEDRLRATERYKEDFKKRRQFSVDFRIHHQDGMIHWCIAEGVPRFHANGEFAGYVGSCIDITKLKKAEEALQKKNNELEKINADLDNFVYTASHDLKAPISNIEGLTSILKDKLSGKLESSEEKILNMIDQSVSRFTRTITDLTEIAKVQKDVNDEIEKLSFKEVLEDVKEDMKEKIVQSGAFIKEDFQVTTFMYARRNLRSILYNLLSNGIKYSSTGRLPELEIKTYKEGEYLVLSVKDNGLGIEKKHLPKMFSMFKRFHKHIDGTGIGLYMIKRIVENKGGRIEVNSELNKGTEFKVYFLLT